MPELGQYEPRVLHVLRVGFLGGAERVALTLADLCRSKGVATMVTCPSGEVAKLSQDKGIPVFPYAFNRLRTSFHPFTLAAYLRSLVAANMHVAAICRRERVEVLHAHHPVAALYCFLSVTRLGLPVILHLHEGPPSRWPYRMALRLAAAISVRIVCVSESGIALLSRTGVGLAKASIVHNGVDPSFLIVGGRGHSPRKAAVDVGVFGVLEPRKGQDVFLNAAAVIASDYPDARFWVVGGASDDHRRYESELREQADTLALRGRVTFTGNVSEVADIMLDMDIVVLSSVSHESLSMVMLEAMTLGRTVVSTTVGSARAAIEDGVTGFLSLPADPEKLADAVKRAILADRSKIGEGASATARQKFSAESMAVQIVSIYRAAIGAGKVVRRRGVFTG